MSIRSLRQAGDTIVEVLICMAIVSGSLGVSYGIGRKSLARVRDAEERGQAIKLGEQQIERFKQYLKSNPTITTQCNPSPPAPGVQCSATPTSVITAGTGGFCFYKDLSKHTIVADPTNGPRDPHCALDQNGNFYCEPPMPACGPGVTAQQADDAGYGYRSVIINLRGVVGGVQDEFYIAAGRFTASGSNANAKSYNIVTLPYRIHQ